MVLLEGLAPELTDAPRLEGAKIVGVPRGGLIVAAVLAYALGVNRDRVGSCDRGDTVILVDDCILSGVRISEAIASCPASTVIVATLFASPEVHDKVEGSDGRVLASVAGEELVDHGADVLGQDYADWTREWEPRVDQLIHTALLDLVVLGSSTPSGKTASTCKTAPRTCWVHGWLASTSTRQRTRSGNATRAPEEVVRADLVGLLEDLAERGLVHPSTPTSRTRGADKS